MIFIQDTLDGFNVFLTRSGGVVLSGWLSEKEMTELRDEITKTLALHETKDEWA